MVLAGWKDLVSTCMLCPQIVSVLQFIKTFQSMADGWEAESERERTVLILVDIRTEV